MHTVSRVQLVVGQLVTLKQVLLSELVLATVMLVFVITKRSINLTVQQHKHANNMSTKSFFILLVSVIIFLFGYYSYIDYSKKQANQNFKNKTFEVNSSDQKILNSELYKLPEGEQIYSISHGKDTPGPKASQIIYSPLSFKVGDKQKIILIFPEKEVVSAATLYLTTDTKTDQMLVLNKDLKENFWFVEWTTNDTVKVRYIVKITVIGPSGEYNNVMKIL